MSNFTVVELDGQLAAAYSHFGVIASALFSRNLKVGMSGSTPQTLRAYARLADLTEKEEGYLRDCVAGIKDFWLSLPPAPSWSQPDGTLTIYYVTRLDTKGKTVLQQTIEWLESHGIRDPIVWREDEA